MQERSLEKRENKSNYKNISQILKRNSNTNSKNKKKNTNKHKKETTLQPPKHTPSPSNKIDGKYREPSNRKKTPKTNITKKARLSL